MYEARIRVSRMKKRTAVLYETFCARTTFSGLKWKRNKKKLYNIKHSLFNKFWCVDKCARIFIWIFFSFVAPFFLPVLFFVRFFYPSVLLWKVFMKLAFQFACFRLADNKTFLIKSTHVPWFLFVDIVYFFAEMLV